MKKIICLLTASIVLNDAQASLLSLLDPLGLFSSQFGFQKSGRETKSRSDINVPPLCKINRAQDGSGNNLDNPDYGKAGSELQRLTPAAYADGKSSMIYRGNPRQISNIVGSIKSNQSPPENPLGLNMLYVLFGQFMDHDLDLTSLNFLQLDLIPVPKGDSSFDQLGLGLGTVTFWRNKWIWKSGVRSFANQITSWIDGNQIYGSSQDTTKKLRSFKQGKLKMSNNMLPRDWLGQFQAGDIRVGQNSGLTSIQTLFVREHNRQCDQINNKYPGLNDEQVYQMARNKIIGLLQKITFKEFLPLLLGPDAYKHYIGAYKGYDNTFNPNVNIEFSTAAYRIGHPLLSNKIDIFDYQNRKIQSVKIQNMFLAHEHIKKPEQIDYYLNGMMRSVSKKKNNQLVDGLRNLLIELPGIKQDLFSVNVKRGRDHGIPDYNTVRRHLGFAPIKSFSQISQSSDTVSRLNKAYQSNCQNLDLWVGIISQDSLPNGELGEVGAAIVGQTFRRIRDGDRFWYENAYPAEQIDEIQKTTLGDIILRNTGLKNLSSDIFKIPDAKNINSNLKEQFDPKCLINFKK